MGRRGVEKQERFESVLRVLCQKSLQWFYKHNKNVFLDPGEDGAESQRQSSGKEQKAYVNIKKKHP